MEKKEKAVLNTTLPKDLLRRLRVLAAEKGVRVNQLLEEGIGLILEKYKSPKK